MAGQKQMNSFYAKFPVKVLFTTTCRVCGKQSEDSQNCHMHEAIPWPELPDNWKICGHWVFCDEHEIEIKIDGDKNIPIIF